MQPTRGEPVHFGATSAGERGTGFASSVLGIMHERNFRAEDCDARPRAGPPRKLLDRLRDAIRLKHYSRRTEEAYAGWARRFILFHGKRHPRDLGEAEVTTF